MDGFYEVVEFGKGFRAQVTQGKVTKFAYGRTRDEAMRRFAYRAEFEIDHHGQKFVGKTYEEALLRIKVQAKRPRIAYPALYTEAITRQNQRS
jgi:hypothetical protein